MAGHSKWANIQHRKNRQDARKAKAFTKVAREITVAARLGGPDPDANARLRAAVLEARAINMPGDNVQRAIDKGSGELGGEAIEEILYEGYAPGGVAVLIEGMTDNRNRTASEIRSLFNRWGGSLAESGSVAWQFERRSLITVTKEGVSDLRIAEAALESGAEDYEDGDDVWMITAAAADLHAVTQALEKAGLEVRSSEWVQVPHAEVELDASTAKQVAHLVERLDDHDDVQNVWTNARAEALEAVGS
jgi:YebC/PmpR family DNA-binding regulatory protein